MYYGFNFAFGSPWASTGAPWCPGTRTRAGPERRGARAPGTGARARPGGGELSHAITTTPYCAVWCSGYRVRSTRAECPGDRESARSSQGERATRGDVTRDGGCTLPGLR
eukprot:scaffold28779_cov66-Phaeocystis_antarctica.AAC.3